MASASLPLSALDDFEVAEGYPDIRGWHVASADGQEVGKVHDLLIDVDHMRTRYLDVRLTKELASSPATATCSYRSGRRSWWRGRTSCACR